MDKVFLNFYIILLVITNSFLFNFSGTHMVVSYGDKIEMIDIIGWKSVVQFTSGIIDRVYSVLFIDTNTIAFGNGDFSICIFTWKTQVIKKTLNGHTSDVRSLIELNGLLASASDDMSIKSKLSI